MPALNHFDYFSDIEEAFIKRRGKHLMIGPIDWALIESWQKREIPLRVVLRAINEVFDSIEERAEATVNVRSLKYCSDAVERLFAEWSSAHVGSSKGLFEPEKTNDRADEHKRAALHISNCIAALESALESLPEALYGEILVLLPRLSKLTETDDVDSLGDVLDKCEARLDSVILTNKKTLLTSDIERAVSTALKQHGFTKEVSAEAFDRVFCREIKKANQIPRLSLYEL